MEKFIPYEKLSKKKQRELDAARRGSWGGLNPVSRKPRNPKAYDRRKARRWNDDSSSVPFLHHRDRPAAFIRLPRRPGSCAQRGPFLRAGKIRQSPEGLPDGRYAFASTAYASAACRAQRTRTAYQDFSISAQSGASSTLVQRS